MSLPIPSSVAEACGPAEVREPVARIDPLSVETEELPEADGDQRDEVWRAQQCLATRLAALVGRSPVECVATLRGPHAATRLWGAHALRAGGSLRVAEELEAARGRRC